MTSRLGCKGQGLVWLAENSDIGYTVPEFEVIDSSYYEELLKQQKLAQLSSLLHNIVNPEDNFVGRWNIPARLEEKCRALSKQFRGREIAVRSSALLSEDSDKFSGAGIYNTVFLKGNSVFTKNLLEAVLEVYASVHSDEAVKYREKAAIQDEKMAVVIQEAVEGDNGVAMSRLPAREGVIPIWWSYDRGAAVQGSKGSKKDNINAVFYHIDKGGKGIGRYRMIFMKENMPLDMEEELLEESLLPLIEKLRKRYGRDFELEFTIDFEDVCGKKYTKKPSALDEKIHLLQIRPLTNVQNKKIKFPDKKPIFESRFCMGAGEYIGKWVTPQQIYASLNSGGEWNEPENYAYVAAVLEKLNPSSFSFLKTFSSYDKTKKYDHLDYDEFTPNKKAIVITDKCGCGIHALTIANERNILCLAGNKFRRDDEGDKHHKHNIAVMGTFIGLDVAKPPHFNIPLEEVGPYIHIVADGLDGRVYRATEQEAREFAEKLK
ncbi:MAG: PEP/pyruvate-binding domain-containing protein [archaeon]